MVEQGGVKSLRHVDVSYEAVAELMSRYSNWGRWGENDELGTLNLITAEKRTEAAKLVRDGLTVSCSRQIYFAPRVSPDEALIPPIHFMQSSGENAPSGMGAAFDWVGMPLHGLYITHVDALSHIFWDGKMYNGRDASAVVTDRGALEGGVDITKDGVMSRGVLLDIPRALGVKRLEPGFLIAAEHLVAAEEFAGLSVESGDVVFVRTGYGAQRLELDGPSASQPGLGMGSLEWIHDRSPAVLCTDSGTDALGPALAHWEVKEPVHVVCLVGMGLLIVDACELEQLSEVAGRLKRWKFMTVFAPLRLKNSTGSPVNPIAVF